jgi:flagellar motility protein MotE (MotC chaperone)
MKNRNRKGQLQDIAQQLARLSVQQETLTTRLTTLLEHEERIQNSTSESEEESEYQQGDLVEITNNYRGAKGTRGVVIRITNQRVTLYSKNNNAQYI